MVAVSTEVSRWCSGISLMYGLPALLSMLFSTVLMMIDFIKPCVTSNKVMDKSMGYVNFMLQQLHMDFNCNLWPIRYMS